LSESWTRECLQKALYDTSFGGKTSHHTRIGG
jgi:hypothetical protein